MTLARVPVGSRARISRVRPESDLHQRLLELGLLPGTEVHVRRMAPLGCPMEVELLGYRLSLRRADASMVEVVSVP